MSVQAPPREIVALVRPELVRFFTSLFQIEVEPGTIVTSWWRDKAVNAAVGGVPNSFHLWGLALDVVAPTPEFLMEQVWLNGLQGIQAVGHVHIEPPGAPPPFIFPESAVA